MFALFIDALNDFEKRVYHNKAFIVKIMSEIAITKGIYINEILRPNFIEIAHTILSELVTDSKWEKTGDNVLYVKKKVCSYCKEFKSYSMCDVCGLVYCSRKCQKLDWPVHKFICTA